MSKKKTKTSSTSTGTATTTPNVPDYISGPAQGFFGQVGSLLNDSAPVTGTPASLLQTQAFNGAAGLSGMNPAILNAIQGSQGLMNFTPSSVSAGQLSNTDLSPYMNPFTQSVIDTSVSDLERAREGAISYGQDAATKAGAYGGSRHGVADAETNRGFLSNVGSLVANLRNTGYQNAQQAALADISNRLSADTGNADRGLSGAQFRLGAANQAGALGLSSDNNMRQNLAAQAALGGEQRAIAQENDPTQARIRRLAQIAQLLGINPSDLIGQTINQHGTQSGTQTQSGGLNFGFNWGPFSVGYG